MREAHNEQQTDAKETMPRMNLQTAETLIAKALANMSTAVAPPAVVSAPAASGASASSIGMPRTARGGRKR